MTRHGYATRKRAAPDSAQVEAQTLPPNIRPNSSNASSLGLDASQPTNHTPPTSSPEPAQLNDPSAKRQFFTYHKYPIVNGKPDYDYYTRLEAEEKAKQAEEQRQIDLDKNDLATNLSILTKKQLTEILLSVADTDETARSVIETQAKPVAFKKRRQAEARKGRAEKKKIPLTFGELLDRVDKHMNSNKGWNWSRMRELEEAFKVTCEIETMFAQILERCPENASFEVRFDGFKTMCEIWSIVIFGTPSVVRAECRNDSQMWTSKFLDMFDRFTTKEKAQIYNADGFMSDLSKTTFEWAAHCHHEDMFLEMLDELKKADETHGQSRESEEHRSDGQLDAADAMTLPSSSSPPPLATSTVSRVVRSPLVVDLTDDL